MVAHAVRIFQTETFASGLGSLGFLFDQHRRPTNTVLGSVFATLSDGIPVPEEHDSCEESVSLSQHLIDTNAACVPATG